MDKSDLDFLIDSQDADLLYKHILEAVCSNPAKIRDGINRYTIDLVIIHLLSTSIFYRYRYNSVHIDIGRVDKYVMEL